MNNSSSSMGKGLQPASTRLTKYIVRWLGPSYFGQGKWITLDVYQKRRKGLSCQTGGGVGLLKTWAVWAPLNPASGGASLYFSSLSIKRRVYPLFFASFSPRPHVMYYAHIVRAAILYRSKREKTSCTSWKPDWNHSRSIVYPTAVISCWIHFYTSLRSCWYGLKSTFVPITIPLLPAHYELLYL